VAKIFSGWHRNHYWFSGSNLYQQGIRKKIRVGSQEKRLTKRAPDAGESAQISSSFLRLIIFLAGRLRRPRPSAGNANR